jgi:3-phosphoshikimate 1-carboxyvinyltransferase
MDCNITTAPSLSGELTPPPSKSHTLRAILLASLCKGTSTIENYLDSPDSDAMIQACRMLGASIDKAPTLLKIHGVNGNPSTPCDVIDSGNSGIVLRFVSACAALCPGHTVITGDASIRNNRPMAPLLEALHLGGVSASSSRDNGYAPIIIKGPYHPGDIFVDGEDSQHVSALMLLASFTPGRSAIHVKNSGERPWLDMTLYWLDILGVIYERKNSDTYIIEGKKSYEAFTVKIPSDFSAAAYPAVATLLSGGAITLHNIDMADPQGDKKLFSVLQELGGNILYDETKHTLKVFGGHSLTGKTIDVNDIIDALPLLAVVGCYAEGETHLINGAIARKKESNRIAAIACELKKMGADIQETADGLIIKKSPLHGASLASYHDHRIIMSLFAAANTASGPSTIYDIDMVSKSYANFFSDMKSLGARLS